MTSTINASTTAGLVNTADTSGVLQLQTAGTTAVTVDASQNVGIGTASPTGFGTPNLHINGTNPIVHFTTPTSGTASGDGSQIGQSGLEFDIYNFEAGRIGFGTSGAERMRIPATGGIQSVSSISVGNTAPTASGAGITFPATQSASSDANTLDDYERGTFTPTFTPQSGAFTTLSNVFGAYTKTGNVVNLSMTYQIASIGTAGGGVTIGNLPFSGIANRYAGVIREIAVNGYVGSVYFSSSTQLNQALYSGGSAIVANGYFLINIQYYA